MNVIGIIKIKGCKEMSRGAQAKFWRIPGGVLVRLCVGPWGSRGGPWRSLGGSSIIITIRIIISIRQRGRSFRTLHLCSRSASASPSASSLASDSCSKISPAASANGVEASKHCTCAADQHQHHHQHHPKGPKLQNTAPLQQNVTLSISLQGAMLQNSAPVQHNSASGLRTLHVCCIIEHHLQNTGPVQPSRGCRAQAAFL